MKDIMYGRALSRLSILNLESNYKDEEVMKKNILKMYHFHIDAFHDKISINKMDPEQDTAFDIEPRMVEPGYIYSKKRPITSKSKSN